VGLLVLAAALDRRLRKARDQNFIADDAVLAKMLFLLLDMGGFAAPMRGLGARTLLRRARGKAREIDYVCRIVSFLCRIEGHPELNKFSIEDAKHFVYLWAHEDQDTYGLSKISKVWERYKDAAPILFAFRPLLTIALPSGKQRGPSTRMPSPDELLEATFKLASHGRSIARLLGRAAYAAEILSRTARNVRLKDFRNIQRAAPPLHPFSQTEVDIINSIHRDAPIA
jgi:hypothetical protein